jgi:hypothetical protein
VFDSTAPCLSVSAAGDGDPLPAPFPQYEADRRHGKKTPIVRLGPVAAGRWVP